MAETAMFSVVAKLLSTIASPAFDKAYKRACSIRSARSELSKLSRSIETVQGVLLDAESKQDSSVAVKSWIKRVRDVLYDAEDLFDDVATDDLLGKHVEGNKLLKKVRGFFSDDSIAKRVEGIRRSLDEISKDMKQFQFVECRAEKRVYGNRQETAFVGLQNVVGRDHDTKVVLEMLSHEPNDVHVIAIVEIGGMGKTTLAQLIYNHEDVRRFDKRWFACISDTSDDREVFGRILRSMCKKDCASLSVEELQSEIEDSVKGEKFVLFLDDVWDHDRGSWIGRISSLSGGAKGSKIVVTTRSLEVARAVGALETHTLDGLSEADSWDLFKRVVGFTPEQERDSKWTSLGEEIVKKCANVPLAIKSIASLLFERNTLQEWESFRKEELSKLGEGHKDGIMPVLRLSYEHLPSNLKHCFAYCALFPKNYEFRKDELVYLWIAQGYIKPSNEQQTVEDVGHSYFMDLFRRSFFQDLKLIGNGDAVCMMHDLIHDLARHVAGDEVAMLTESSTRPDSTLRHVGVWGLKKDGSVVMPISLHNANPLRTFIDDVNVIGMEAQNPESRFQLANLRALRALSWSHWKPENVPSCIGELKHLRYLHLSLGDLKRLPNSITRLVNLCTLNITGCSSLEVLPDHFRKFISLRHLINRDCTSLKHMPPGFEELTSLQRLDVFKVGMVTTGNRRSRLEVLSSLELKEQLQIWFKDETDDWDGVECWQPPLTLQGLKIYGYKGVRIPRLRNDTCVIMPKLTHLHLCNCSGVKCLPPLRHLPMLSHLTLSSMRELQYVQEEDQDGKKQSPQMAAGSSALLLPDLKELELITLPKLKGWWRKGEATTTHKDEHLATDPNNKQASSHSLSFPSLVSLTLYGVNINMIQQLFSSYESTSPSSTTAATTTSSPSSSSLEFLRIYSCHELLSFPGESLTSLRCLHIWHCKRLKEVRIPPSQLNIIEELTLLNCQELELWGAKKRGVDWNSLPGLRKLTAERILSQGGLPHCLRLLEELGQLKIKLEL